MSAQRKIRSINPATNEILGEVEVSSPEQIKAAVSNARKAQKAWRELGVAGRVKALKSVHEGVAARREELAKLISQEMGRPIEGSLKSIDGPLVRMKWDLDNAAAILAPETTFENDKELHQVHYEPFGVFGIIAPWNYPLSNFGMTAVQPLLAGNTVVYKLSEEVPLFGKALDEIFKQSGVPDGVFNQVFGAGDVGELLAHSDVDHLHFTGSTAVGRKLYQIAAGRFVPITLELGGSDAGIVFEDADIDRMIEPIFWARFTNSGQTCCALKRLYVHKSRYDELASKLAAFAKKQRVGNPLEGDTAIGPMVSEKQRKLLSAQLEDAIGKGAKIVFGDSSPKEGKSAFFEPVLLAGVTPDMRAANEELFGPVLSISTFTDEDEVIRAANNTLYGLSAYVYTEDRARYARVASQLEAGCISHNETSYFHPANPFGGYKQSGLGRSCGKIGLQSCCQVKVITTAK